MDGLRGIAVLLVVWFHFWQITWITNEVSVFGKAVDFEFIPIMGFVGVDLFFFVSGFCLMLPYLKGPAPSAREFYFRRAVKILPSLWLSLAFMIPVFGGYFADRTEFWQRLVAHLLFVNNLDRGTMGSINGVLWSLAVEAQFYLVFPWLVRAFLAHPLRTFAWVNAIGWSFRIWLSLGDPTAVDFRMSQLPAALDLFLVGMTVSYLFSRHGRPLAARNHMGWIGAAVAVVSAVGFLFLLHTGYVVRYTPGALGLWHSRMRLPMAALFGVFLFSSLVAGEGWKKLVGGPVLVFFSTISYNLYIWHQAIGRAFVRIHVPEAKTLDPHADPAWALPAFLLMIAASVCVATFFTYRVERPLLEWGSGFCADKFRRGSKRNRARTPGASARKRAA